MDRMNKNKQVIARMMYNVLHVVSVNYPYDAWEICDGYKYGAAFVGRFNKEIYPTIDDAKKQFRKMRKLKPNRLCQTYEQVNRADVKYHFYSLKSMFFPNIISNKQINFYKDGQ